tara:strand:+ start:846 stop:1064 length:219 start_codon:yes stop_codon:yes gene_type:complete
MKKDKDWLILNAVIAYIHHYPNNQFTQQYKDLKDELINPPTVRKRGRKAKRQRKEETASPETNKEAVETTQT